MSRVTCKFPQPPTFHLKRVAKLSSYPDTRQFDMASLGDTTMPATRRQRKSIGGHLPSSKSMDKENATVDLGSTLAANRKKSRSKSIGPGGLDVLKSGSGNRRAVRDFLVPVAGRN